MAKPNTRPAAAEAAPDETTAAPTEPTLAPALHDVHLILQGKGGAGKSVVASLLAQYLTEIAEGAEVESGVKVPLCIDTDPINDTFSRYHGQGFNVHHLAITDEDGINIDAAKFDNMVEMILAEDPPHATVIDTGTSNFLPFLDYVKSCQIPLELANAGFRLVLHIVISGGNTLQETLQSFETICQNLAAWTPLNIVVWINPFHGPVRTERWNHFLASNTFRDYEQNVKSIVELPQLGAQLHAKDFRKMLTNNHTFGSALADSHNYAAMCRSRLRHVRASIWELIDQAFYDLENGFDPATHALRSATSTAPAPATAQAR